MAVRDDFASGEVLTATDLNDTFGSKLDLAGGKILQIVRTVSTTGTSTTSTSFVDVTGMSVTITPQKSDSAILLIASGSVSISNTSLAAAEGRFAITDSSNNEVSGSGPAFRAFNVDNTGAARLDTPLIIVGYSTPATTSATTYKMRVRSVESTTTTAINHATAAIQLYAIEVSA